VNVPVGAGARAARAIDELKIGDERTELFDRILLERRPSLDHDQKIVFTRWRQPRDSSNCWNSGVFARDN
jgi:hypothetical protein